MTPELKSVIDDAAALAALAEPAFKKVAELELSQQDLTSKVASLSTQLQQKVARDEQIKTASLKAATFFETRGMLKCSAADFAARLQDNPAEIFTVVESFVDQATLKEAGYPLEGSSTEDGRDPLEVFCGKN